MYKKLNFSILIFLILCPVLLSGFTFKIDNFLLEVKVMEREKAFKIIEETKLIAERLKSIKDREADIVGMLIYDEEDKELVRIEIPIKYLKEPSSKGEFLADGRMDEKTRKEFNQAIEKGRLGYFKIIEDKKNTTLIWLGKKNNY